MTDQKEATGPKGNYQIIEELRAQVASQSSRIEVLEKALREIADGCLDHRAPHRLSRMIEIADAALTVTSADEKEGAA